MTWHGTEIEYVQSTLLAAAIVACFSWPERPTQHWIGPAAWYSGLILSITGVFLSSTMTFIFVTAKSSPKQRRLAEDLSIFAHVIVPDEEVVTSTTNTNTTTGPVSRGPTQSRPMKISVKRNMIFVWQAPMGLMAYSAIGFIIGLMVYVSTPLYDGSAFGGDAKVSPTIPNIQLASFADLLGCYHIPCFLCHCRSSLCVVCFLVLPVCAS